jgi:hypothetical protein
MNGVAGNDDDSTETLHFFNGTSGASDLCVTAGATACGIRKKRT